MINCIKGFTEVQREGKIKVTLVHINYPTVCGIQKTSFG